MALPHRVAGQALVSVPWEHALTVEEGQEALHWDMRLAQQLLDAVRQPGSAWHAYAKYQHDPDFLSEFKNELAHFVGRPSPIYHAARMTNNFSGGASRNISRPCKQSARHRSESRLRS